MTGAKSFVRNSTVLLGSEVLNGILLFFFTIAVARTLGPTDAGVLGYAIGLTTLLAVIADAGLTNLATREIARDPARQREYWSDVLVLRLLLGIVLLALVPIVNALVGSASGNPAPTLIVLLLALHAVAQQLTAACSAVFRGTNRMWAEALAKIGYSALLTTLGFWLAWRNADVRDFGVIYTIAAGCQFLLCLLLLRLRFWPLAIRPQLARWAGLLRAAWPFALSLIFISIYYYLDTVMLKAMQDDVAVGWYTFAYKIVLFVLQIASVLVTALFPIISRQFTHQREALAGTLGQFAKLMATLALPIGFAGTILARDIMVFLYGDAYAGGGTALAILLWTAAVIYVSVIFGNSLQAVNRQRIYMFGVAAGAIVNIIANIALIPRWSLNGAAVATLIAEITVLLYMYVRLRSVVVVPLFRHLPRPIIASIAMSAVLWLTPDWQLLVRIAVAALTYVVILLLVRGITRQDIALIRTSLQR